MLVIPIQPVPSQQVLCVLAGQNCQINIYARSAKGFTNIYVDLNSNGTSMFLATLAHNGVPLDPCNSYDGFQGNLFFIDTQGTDDPQFDGFGTRWFLVYLTPAELALTAPVFTAEIANVTVLTLSAMLNVTAPGPGNFSVAHGLDVVPFLIDIIQTTPASDPPGLVWGQTGFADNTNVNLVGSDTGVTATVLVWTAAASYLETIAPSKTLLVSSTAPGAFTVAHGLGAVPSFVEILPTSAGLLWETAAADATNIYLEASDAGVTATIYVFPAVTGAVNIAGPATTLGVTAPAPGAFSIAHGLSAAPSRIGILMISAGEIWAANPAFDGINVYLDSSDIGISAQIFVYS